MELKEILAISGQPGLYKYVAQSTRGVIVESLLDGRRMNASASARVSALSEISMFTEGDDIALADVFTRIYEHTGGKAAIDPTLWVGCDLCMQMCRPGAIGKTQEV